MDGPRNCNCRGPIGAVEYRTLPPTRQNIVMSIRIVLVGTTHPGNIGAVARAMKNMGVTDLALVNPRYFPDKEATARASGAEDLLEEATVVDTLAEAVADCVYVAGASARSRAINWPCLDARDCAARLLEESAKGPVAAVFGPEKSGLSNSDLDHCGSQCSSCGACRDCGICVSVCPQHAISRKGLDDEAYEYVVDEDLCIGCGFCAGACPCGVWDLV